MAYWVRGVDIGLAGGWIEVASIVHPPGEVVVSMRPVSVFAEGQGSEIEQLLMSRMLSQSTGVVPMYRLTVISTAVSWLAPSLGAGRGGRARR